MLHYWLVSANIYVFGCFGLQTAVARAKLSSCPGLSPRVSPGVATPEARLRHCWLALHVLDVVLVST